MTKILHCILFTILTCNPSKLTMDQPVSTDIPMQKCIRSTSDNDIRHGILIARVSLLFVEKGAGLGRCIERTDTIVRQAPFTLLLDILAVDTNFFCQRYLYRWAV